MIASPLKTSVSKPFEIKMNCFLVLLSLAYASASISGCDIDEDSYICEQLGFTSLCRKTKQPCNPPVSWHYRHVARVDMQYCSEEVGVTTLCRIINGTTTTTPPRTTVAGPSPCQTNIAGLSNELQNWPFKKLGSPCNFDENSLVCEGLGYTNLCRKVREPCNPPVSWYYRHVRKLDMKYCGEEEGVTAPCRIIETTTSDDPPPQNQFNVDADTSFISLT